MTREEAIYFANCLKNNYTVDLDDMEAFCDMAIKALAQEPVFDKITELIEPLRHLSIDEMSDIEWDILRMIDKYKAET